MKSMNMLCAAVLFVVLPVAIAWGGDKPEAGDKADDYPLETCPVSGEKLGSMGKPYVYEIRLCCKGCLNKFLKDPKPYIHKIEAARKDAENKSDAHDAHGDHGGGGSKHQHGH